MKPSNKKIYLDYAASTPVDPEVFKAMEPYFREKFGNAGSLHSFGQEALSAIDKSRETIAKAIGRPAVARFREIIFTGSATEANNLALRGVVKKARSAIFENQNTDHAHAPPRIIVSSIEHESVLETAKDLEKDGVEVIYLPVDKAGVVDLKKLEESLNERTILVSVMYVNNEIGTIEPIFEISRIIRDFRIARLQDCKIKKGENNSAICNLQSAIYPLFHTDAVQAFQYLDCDVRKLGVDLMTLSAHKIYGPKGVGALYCRNCKIARLQDSKNDGGNFAISNLQSVISPTITGGGQEFGLRSGTENTPAIAGFGKTVELVNNSRESESERVRGLRDYFWRELKKIYPKAEINGCQLAPHILNVCFPGELSQDLLIKLDMAGVAVSSGAACSVRSSKPSHVLKALGLPTETIRGSLRFSFGRFTTKKEIDETLKILTMTLK